MSSAIGVNVRRADGEDKVRGRATYGLDYGEPGMLHCKLLRAPVAAARILAVRTERAVALPGVHAIVTAADVPAVTSGWVLKDQPVFARDQVCYIGEPVAAVAADSERQAAAAVAAIELELEPLAPVLDTTAALARGARLVHPDWESYPAIAPGSRDGNIAWEATLDRGDVEAAFAAAHRVIEDTFTTQRQHQSPIEPHVAVARFENGRYVVHTPTQFPFLVRDRLAEWLSVPASGVRVVGTTIGGGFGGKIDALLEPYACVLAKRTGRPVPRPHPHRRKLQTAGPRENAEIRLRTAVSATGETPARGRHDLRQRRLQWRGRCVRSDPRARVRRHLPRARRPNRTKVVYTNTTPTAAFRGVNGPYCVFALEQHLDHIAAELGVDRLQWRRDNVVRPGEKIVNGQMLEDAAYEEAFAKLDELAPWPAAPDRGNGDTNDTTPLRGVGVSAVTWLTNPGPGGATSRSMRTGRSEWSVRRPRSAPARWRPACSVVAEELSVAVADVLLVEPDTDSGQFDNGAQGSRTTCRARQRRADGVRRCPRSAVRDRLWDA